MDRRPPSARDVTNTNRRKRAPAATAAGATGRRQWFAGLAATQPFNERVPAVHGAITGREALFVDGQKCRIAHALPERGTIGRERLHAIGIGRENQAVAKSGRKPVGQRAGNSCSERKHALPPEGAVGFLVVRIGVVTGNGEQHRRHAKGQRDLARGRMLGLQKIHVARRQRHRLPVEASFQHQRPSSIGGALILLGECLLDPVVLGVGEHGAIGAGIDQCAGRACRIVEKRLVPASRSIVGIDRRQQPLLSGSSRSDRRPG